MPLRFEGNQVFLWEPDPDPIPRKSTPAGVQVPIIIRFPYPLLSNLVLDELDRELTRRGHRFCRYADDCNIYVRSQRAGERVMASVARFLTTTLRLKVNESKSAVARPEERKFLGFSIANDGSERRIAPQALAKFKARIRDLTSRTRGISLHRMIETLKPYLVTARKPPLSRGICDEPPHFRRGLGHGTHRTGTTERRLASNRPAFPTSGHRRPFPSRCAERGGRSPREMAALRQRGVFDVVRPHACAVAQADRCGAGWRPVSTMQRCAQTHRRRGSALGRDRDAQGC